MFSLFTKNEYEFILLLLLLLLPHTQAYHASVTSQSLKLPNHLTTTHCLGIAWILGSSSLTKVLQCVDVDSIHWHIRDINLPHFRCLTSPMFLIFSFHKFSILRGVPVPSMSASGQASAPISSVFFLLALRPFHIHLKTPRVLFGSCRIGQWFTQNPLGHRQKYPYVP